MGKLVVLVSNGMKVSFIILASLRIGSIFVMIAVLKNCSCF